MDFIFWIPIIISIITLFWNLWQQRSIESLKSKNEKATLIHKIQFEKEFDIYKDLWSSLIDLKRITESLRPELDHVDINQSDAERKRERLEKLDEIFIKFLNSFEKNKPFYSEKVYLELSEIIKIVKTEAFEFQKKRENIDYWDEAKSNIKKITLLLDKTSDIIRNRIGLIS